MIIEKLRRFLTINYSRVAMAITLAASFAFLNPALADLSDITVSNIDEKLFCPIVKAMSTVLIAISVIMILWAAYLFVTAQDDAEKVTKARKTITYAAVAIVVVVLANGFPFLIKSIFGGGGGRVCLFS